MKRSGNALTKLELLYADRFFIALHKDAGIPCQSKNLEPYLPLDKSLEQYLNEPVRIWTRIDQPVSGIVLFHRMLEGQISGAHEILDKTYLAIVEGHPEGDSTLISRLSRDGRKKKALADNEHGKRAELTFFVLKKFDRYSLLMVRPSTGRFHQIRQQLAQSGHPVKGDIKYGARRKNPDRSIHLHAITYVVRLKDQSTVKINDYSFPDDALWDLARDSIVRGIVSTHLS